MKTLAIIPGWAGGPRLTRHFADALKQNGYQVLNNASKADIIFAHSAGCYKIPQPNQANLIILLGPPYWPERSIFSRLLRHGRSNAVIEIAKHGLRHYLRDLCWRTVYAVIHPTMTFITLARHKQLSFLDKLRGKRAILIRNKDDHLCSPSIKEVVRIYKNIKFVELPGGHDDYYINPSPYIDLLLKEL